VTIAGGQGELMAQALIAKEGDPVAGLGVRLGVAPM
jgi:hypothetical protein